jgi:hypothetical protein
MAFALFSAALYEAAFFGIYSFLPVIEQDGIFPLEMLNFLKMKKNEENQNIVNALENFLNKDFVPNSLDIIAKAEIRMNLFAQDKLYQNSKENPA